MTAAADTVDTGPGERAAIIADESLGGRALCHALAAATDRWLTSLYEQAVASYRYTG